MFYRIIHQLPTGLISVLIQFVYVYVKFVLYQFQPVDLYFLNYDQQCNEGNYPFDAE
jgi:hypothetical protein